MRWCLVILVILVGRTWWPPMTGSFWIDETLTAFIMRHGLDHPSVDAAPAARDTIYYPLLSLWQGAFGASELSLRIPSLLLSLIALYFLWRIAARMIHPYAAWIAVFLCFLPRGFALRATEARPYALGLALAAAAMWNLIRYLDDTKRWRSAAAFCLCGALLVWTHILLAPFLAICFGFALQRRAPWTHLLSMLALIGAAGIPVVFGAIGLADGHEAHVVTKPPTWDTIAAGVQLPVLVAIAAVAWVVARWRGGRERGEAVAEPSSAFLFAAWWLWQPLLLALVSYATGSGMFVPRYFSTAMLGASLAGAWPVAWFLPKHQLRVAAFAVGGAILLLNLVRPAMSHNSPLREGAALASQWAADGDALVLCPSGFVEAQPPVWGPGTALPGFLYAHLDRYPVTGELLLLPTLETREHPFAMVEQRLNERRRPIVVFGGAAVAGMWESWLSERPQLAGWKHTRRHMGDVIVARFAPP